MAVAERELSVGLTCAVVSMLEGIHCEVGPVSWLRNLTSEVNQTLEVDMSNAREGPGC